MRKIIERLLCVLLAASSADAGDWPQWRGPGLNGISPETSVPERWSPDQNVTWKLAMPAWSGSTPIVWGGHVFLNVADGGDLDLWCVDRDRGTLLWKRRLGAGNVKMQKQNMSSPSPVTDGKHVWALTGTGVLKAFTFQGAQVWSRDLQREYGAFGLNWGYASSPMLWDDSVFVQVLHGMNTDDPSYVMRINKLTGKNIWRVERPTKAIRESPDSYATPAVVRNGAAVEIVISGGDCVTGHDLATGRELWRAGGLNPNNDPWYRVVSSPVVKDGMIFAASKVNPLLAIRTGGRGDITNTHVAWSIPNGPDVPTPVSDGRYLYIVNDRGIVSCLDARTGREIYGGQRIKPGTYSASPVLVAGKIYVTSEEGVTTVYRAGPKFELVAENSLNDYVLSSMAVSGGQLFIRTGGHLYCIGKRQAPSSSTD